MSDLLSAPSSSPPAWVARLAIVRESVTPVRVVMAVAAVAAAVAFGLVFLRTPSHPAELVLPKAGDVPPATSAASGGPAGPPAPAGAGPPTSATGGGGVGVVTAHAAGQVAAPGVYSVPAGSRRRRSGHGGRRVSARGRPRPAEPGRQGGRRHPGLHPPQGRIPAERGAGRQPGRGVGRRGWRGGQPPGRAPAGPVDLNTATAAQLDTLPGVGPATANAILTYRTRNGRFKSVTELLEVPGIGPAKLEAIRPLVMVS